MSRQPQVKTHDHHSFSLYHYNVLHSHSLTVSYTLKFMTSSQCRNWFSMLRFPFLFLLILIFIFDGSENMMCWIFLHCSITYDVVKSDLMAQKNTSSWSDIRQETMEYRDIIQPTKWLQISISTLKCHNKCMSLLFKIVNALQGLYSLCNVFSS